VAGFAEIRSVRPSRSGRVVPDPPGGPARCRDIPTPIASEPTAIAVTDHDQVPQWKVAPKRVAENWSLETSGVQDPDRVATKASRQPMMPVTHQVQSQAGRPIRLPAKTSGVRREISSALTNITTVAPPQTSTNAAWLTSYSFT
jgi:hypothetical protein